jgi:hypothetical protein
MIENTSGFTGCGKNSFSEGYGLQAVRNCFEMNSALAAEGWFLLEPAIFRSLFSP